MDFLDVEEVFNIYKTNPQYVTDFLHVDLEFYKKLFPDDILSEYNKIQKYLNLNHKEESTKQESHVKTVTETINSKGDFNKKVDYLIATFKHYIEHKKGHSV